MRCSNLRVVDKPVVTAAFGRQTRLEVGNDRLHPEVQPELCDCGLGRLPHRGALPRFPTATHLELPAFLRASACCKALALGVPGPPLAAAPVTSPLPLCAARCVSDDVMCADSSEYSPTQGQPSRGQWSLSRPSTRKASGEASRSSPAPCRGSSSRMHVGQLGLVSIQSCGDKWWR
eukprot:scaffold155332_cov34-Tisochrysis_lutea.AAC.1